MGNRCTAKPKAAFVFPALWGDGLERVTFNLSRGLLCRGINVDLVVGSSEGELTNAVPNGCNLIDLCIPRKFRLIRGLPKLFCYFLTSNPQAVTIYWGGLEFLAILCARIAYAGRNRPRVVYAIHNVSRWIDELPPVKRFLAKPLTWLTLRTVDVVIAVSKGVADEFGKRFRFPVQHIQVIYNPVVLPEIEQLANEPLDHPFFASGSPPVVLGVGRLTKQKDFATLIRAFALLRKRRPLKLIILGEGEDRSRLEALIDDLGRRFHAWLCRKPL